MTSATSGKTSYATPSDTELTAIRVFDATREMVFDAHTIPEHVQKWLLGPDGWSMPVCELDLKPGGKWRYVWRKDDDGTEMQMSGIFTEVDRPSRYVFTERWGDEWPETINITEFTEKNGRTTMKLTVKYPSKEIRDKAMATGMTGGMDTSYDRLDTLLQTIASV
jgi:uncharacterized protein YndB with AHSA1/START domain